MSEEMPLYLRFSQLKKIFFGGSLGRSTIDRWERENGFPRRIKVGVNSIVWDSRLVKQWIEARASQD